MPTSVPNFNFLARLVSEILSPRITAIVRTYTTIVTAIPSLRSVHFSRQCTSLTRHSSALSNRDARARNSNSKHVQEADQSEKNPTQHLRRLIYFLRQAIQLVSTKDGGLGQMPKYHFSNRRQTGAVGPESRFQPVAIPILIPAVGLRFTRQPELLASTLVWS